MRETFKWSSTNRITLRQTVIHLHVECGLDDVSGHRLNVGVAYDVTTSVGGVYCNDYRFLLYSEQSETNIICMFSSFCLESHFDFFYTDSNFI